MQQTQPSHTECTPHTEHMNHFHKKGLTQDAGADVDTVGDMQKWPKFSSDFHEKQKMDFQLRPFLHVADDIHVLSNW